MTLLLYLVMILAAIGMIIGVMKDKQGYTWGRPLALVCIIVVLLVAVTNIMPDRSPQRMARRYRQQQQQYNEIVGEKIGQKLAVDFADGRALVIGLGEHTENYAKGLEKGVNGKVSLELVEPSYEMFKRTIMDMEGMGPQDAEDMEEMVREYMFPEGMEMFLRATMMDELIEKGTQEPDVIVSFIGLPYDFREMRLWRQRNHPPLVITADMGMMEMRNITDAINRGRIAAMVMRKPGVGLHEDDIPRDLDEAFDSRYIMVTQDNVQEMISEYPDLFMQGF